MIRMFKKVQRANMEKICAIKVWTMKVWVKMSILTLIMNSGTYEEKKKSSAPVEE